MVMRGASVANPGMKGDGLSAYRGWEGTECTKPAARLEERVPCATPMSAGSRKFDVRWQEGVWLGFRVERGGLSMGTSEGVAKARGFRRKAENGRRWSVEDFNKFVGAPWEAVPRSTRMVLYQLAKRISRR